VCNVCVCSVSECVCVCSVMCLVSVSVGTSNYVIGLLMLHTYNYGNLIANKLSMPPYPAHSSSIC